MNQTLSRKKRRFSLFPPLICTAVVLIAFLCFFSARWFVRVYGRTGFDSILYTLTASLGGVQSGLVFPYLLQALLPSVLCTGLASFLFFFLLRRNATGKYQSSRPRRFPSVPVALLLSAGLIVFAAFDVGLVEYISDQINDSDLYETSYVNPDSVEISFPEKKRNLIYIYLESMETTFLSKELGGAMDENLIPELYQLA